jgi:hypothetical protein
MRKKPHESLIRHHRSRVLQCWTASLLLFDEDFRLTERIPPSKIMDCWLPPADIPNAGSPLPVIYGERRDNGAHVSILGGILSQALTSLVPL